MYIILALAWLLLVGLVLLVLNALGRLTMVDLAFWSISVVLSVLMAVLVLLRVRLTRLNRVLLTSTSLWTFSRLAADIFVLHGLRPATIVLCDALIALAFGFLGVRAAVLFAVGTGVALLVGNLLNPGADWEVVIFNLFTIATIGYMSVYGQQVKAAWLRAERAEQLLERDGETGLPTPEAALVYLEGMAFQVARRRKQLGVILIHPVNLSWVVSETPDKTTEHAFKLIAERLGRICDPQELVALWGKQAFVVAIRSAEAGMLTTRAQALQRSLRGVYWPFGPAIQIEVAAGLIAGEEHLVAELEELNRQLDLGR